MKKAIIVVSVLLAVALVSTTVLGVLLIKDRKELDVSAKKIEEIESQLKDTQEDSAQKDKKIKELNSNIAKKDKELEKTSKELKKKKANEKKAAEEAKKVAEVGEYESEDSTEIVETPGEYAQGTYRLITVSNSTKDSITISHEETTTGGRHIDGFNDGNEVTVKLTNGKGSFSVRYNGWTYGDSTFKANISIVDSKTIQIDCLSDKEWGTHIFRKK